MARKSRFLAAEFSRRWDRSYEALSRDRQEATDEVVIALVKQETTPGMRVKPIRPEKFYSEARINSGDRVVFRIDRETVWFVDVVVHDQIGRYGKEVKGLFA